MSSQKSILASVVKRKSTIASPQEPPRQFMKVQQPSALKCIAVLPGIGDYKSSDDSDGSTEIEDDVGGPIDLTGRQIRKKKECDE